jgi:hypothetical protein
VRIKSAVLALSILLLIAATGCSKSKKSEETPAPTSTASNPATSNATTTAPAAPTTAPSAATTAQPAQNVPAAQAPAEAPKPPAPKKHVVKKQVVSKPAAAEGPAEPSEATAPAVHKPVILPAGTVLTVRLNEAISSKSNHAGDKFTATIDEPVEAGGKVVVPKGSSVSGTVTDAKARGKLKGSALLRLVLDSMTVKEKDYDIETAVVAQSMAGKGKRTAALGGGGAATGALVGAVAGGAKGFGIGMLVGAGVGLAGGAFTGNKNIELPAETLLSFKLLKPVELEK